MKTPINNLMVELLRSGKASQVAGLFSLGVAADIFGELDLVTSVADPLLGSRQEVTRRTVWAWSHEAPECGGVELCWQRLELQLDSMGDRSCAETLKGALNQAVKGALISRQVNSLEFSWDRMLGYALENRFWTRNAMLSILETQCLALPEQSLPVLQGLNDSGRVVRPDFLGWMEHPNSLMESAIIRGIPDLVQLLVDLTDAQDKQVHWLSIADAALIGLLNQGPDAFASLGMGERLVHVHRVLQEWSRESRPSPFLENALQEVHQNWSAVPSALRQFQLCSSLPASSPSRPAKPRF